MATKESGFHRIMIGSGISQQWTLHELSYLKPKQDNVLEPCGAFTDFSQLMTGDFTDVMQFMAFIS